MKIQTTTVTQTSNEVLGTPEKKLYYLIITNEKNEKLVVNVGEKTHDGVKKLLGEDETKLKIEEEKPKGGKK